MYIINANITWLMTGNQKSRVQNERLTTSMYTPLKREALLQTDGGFTSRPDLVVTAAGEEFDCSVAVVGFSDVVFILLRGRGFRTTSA